MLQPKILSVLLGLMIAPVGNFAAGAAPNILIITVDNLGYGDLACYNADSTIHTPNINAWAAQGARFTSFYTASPTCTVSRASLLTGRIPQRHGLLSQLAGVEGNYSVGLRPQEILLPQVLQSAPIPYVTGCFGKWNIGFAPGSRPTERGFDEFLGHASGNLDYYHHHYREKLDLYQGVQPIDREGQYATDLFADACIDFIDRNHSARNHSDSKGAAAPWFCYLAFNAPHFPVAGNKRPGQPLLWQAPDWAFAEYGWSPGETDPERRYAAVVFALDRAIGRVLEKLELTGAAENSLVFLMSDNGAFRLDRAGLDVGSNAPLRGGGVTCWEGGLRVAAMARWPGKIRPGTVIDDPCWTPDLLTTAAAIAAAELPDDRTFDGLDISPLLAEGSAPAPRSFFFNYQRHAALRLGKWKIVRETPHQPWQLFQLSADLAEAHNLAGEYPGKVRALAADYDNWTRPFP